MIEKWPVRAKDSTDWFHYLIAAEHRDPRPSFLNPFCNFSFFIQLPLSIQIMHGCIGTLRWISSNDKFSTIRSLVPIETAGPTKCVFMPEKQIQCPIKHWRFSHFTLQNLLYRSTDSNGLIRILTVIHARSGVSERAA